LEGYDRQRGRRPERDVEKGVVSVEASRIYLDTTFLIDLLRDLPEAVKKAGELKEARSDLSTTSVNAFEAYIGAIRSGNPRRLAPLEALLGDLRILLLGKAEAEASASIMVDLMKEGKPVEMRDALIAGSMLENNYNSIVTRDVDHFSRIPKLEVVSY
jgi:predicted nucleic acid-binding protein